MKDIESLSTKELIAIYNANSGKAPISAWKRKVSELKAAVLKLAPSQFFVGPAPSRPVEEFEASNVELSKQAGRPVDADEKEVDLRQGGTATKSKDKPSKAKKPKVEKPKSDRGAIRRYTEEMLLKVKGTDPETKKPMGLPYSEVLDKVLEKFPNASTSLNCLRWYATKMNKRTGAEKVIMPLRPKAKEAA